MTTQTGGWLASMTKMITSVAAMIAVEKGLVSLDEDVRQILPELRQKEVLVTFDKDTKIGKYVPVTEQITLRYLQPPKVMATVLTGTQTSAIAFFWLCLSPSASPTCAVGGSQ
jgi:predicted transcriptional regulator